MWPDAFDDLAALAAFTAIQAVAVACDVDRLATPHRSRDRRRRRRDAHLGVARAWPARIDVGHVRGDTRARAVPGHDGWRVGGTTTAAGSTSCSPRRWRDPRHCSETSTATHRTPCPHWRDTVPFGVFTAPFNITGQPAMSVPTSTSGDLPIGVQLVAATGREDLLFRVVAELEQVRPWAGRTPRWFFADALPRTVTG